MYVCYISQRESGAVGVDLPQGDWLARPARAPDAPAPAAAAKKLPAWFGLGRGDVRRNADGPHDMESIRAAVARGIAAERCGEGAR